MCVECRKDVESPTAYYRWNKDGVPVWYCLIHQNRLTYPFWANGDESFIVECCKCEGVVTAS